MKDIDDPRRWTLQRCKILGQPKREERPSSEPEPLAKVIDAPGMENWDRLLREKKRKDREEFLKRWPTGVDETQRPGFWFYQSG